MAKAAVAAYAMLYQGRSIARRVQYLPPDHVRACRTPQHKIGLPDVDDATTGLLGGLSVAFGMAAAKSAGDLIGYLMHHRAMAKCMRRQIGKPTAGRACMKWIIWSRLSITTLFLRSGHMKVSTSSWVMDKIRSFGFLSILELYNGNDMHCGLPIP